MTWIHRSRKCFSHTALCSRVCGAFLKMFQCHRLLLSRPDTVAPGPLRFATSAFLGSLHTEPARCPWGDSQSSRGMWKGSSHGCTSLPSSRTWHTAGMRSILARWTSDQTCRYKGSHSRLLGCPARERWGPPGTSVFYRFKVTNSSWCHPHPHGVETQDKTICERLVGMRMDTQLVLLLYERGRFWYT